ncbi:MFS transporter [Shewanella inventionis]|uniref:3-methyl-2-oxobutanoate dehydrogenase (2-methylpropanoyl-transferring) n=1 Tax=Shewanella inventionis TaxID=1738770 RepID=A0ABQ1IWU0_9GAMM|nr:alpha-ketoacid dehydrogenase subunit alpha/beta [Shewanella inventionis]MCL1158362.1 thiamine pyrophosphate-dependent enzyme [Shewanella inventionis]UAL41814.1 MFS transporter [Shewanella inventionis]GGB52133.1 MFS transporter [Shewanella inventionis]
MEDRAIALEQQFIERVLAEDFEDIGEGWDHANLELSDADFLGLFESQLKSRLLDLESRRMRARNQGFYTIGSSGHEGNAAYALATRPTDMAFLHYRSAAFMIERGRRVAGETQLWDMLLSFSASSDDPISGGRHKVLGSKRLFIPPQTSTIASHLPKAIGAAFSIPLTSRLSVAANMPADSIVVCNFGDASSNHASAQTAINAACWTAYQQIPLPIMFVCEDNGIGISTRTPKGWITANFSQRAGLKYFHCDGRDVLDTYRVSKLAADYVRKHKKPVFLHVRTVRLMGHAGSDAEIAYLSKDYILQNEAQDPLLVTAQQIIKAKLLTSDQVIELYQELKARISAIAMQVVNRPKLQSAAQVMASIIPPKIVKSTLAESKPFTEDAFNQLMSADKLSLDKPVHMGKLINLTLTELMGRNDNIVVCGEDVGKKGGVYHVTSRLVERFGPNRVINTLLDETAILGLAIGMAHNGILPIPEIQFLAYVHNAEDQIRGEAATLSFFSNGQFTNPMVIRIAGLGYQKGFGGHFHNDNSFTVFRDIPGLILACPSNGEDAMAMLRECVRLAQEEQRVVVFLEPIALYMTRDLHEVGDNLWAGQYVPQAKALPLVYGELGLFGEGKDLCIISYGNGYYLSRQAEKILAEQGIAVTVIDLRYLAPLNETAIAEKARHCRHILIVDECRRSGSVSEAIITSLHEQLGSLCPEVARITAEDCYIPLADAATLPLPMRDTIVDAALALVKNNPVDQSANQALDNSLVQQQEIPA